jgi:UDP-glucose 4-epimerase
MLINKILVTGSSGTIGTRLCEKLLDEGYDVIGLDSKHNKWSKRIDNLTIIGDLRDNAVYKEISGGIDLIVHFAANARVYDLVADPVLARDNVEMTFNVLEFCRKSHIKRLIFSSSREVYGNTTDITHLESVTAIDNCESPYSASKIAGEALVQAYRKCYGIDFIITRFSNVYGMYDESDRVIPLFIRLTRNNQDLIIYGKDKLLDFTYIDDTVNGTIRCIKSFDQAKNNVYNIASGSGTTIVYVAKLIQRYMGASNKIIIKDNRTGEVVKCIADISKAEKVLGYKPTITVEDGIKYSIQWYLDGNKNGQ